MVEQMKSKTTRTQDEGWHLVLGGSDGIGFAFAKWLSERRRRLVVVSRGREHLVLARKELLALGAAEVRTVAGDLLQQAFRSHLFRRLSKLPLSTIFIGGPSPRAGAIGDITGKQIESAAQSCLAYPVHVMSFAIANSCKNRLTVVFLSSSASREGLADHPFLLSAAFRRAAEQTLRRMAALRVEDRMKLVILRPSVVYTRLAMAYAQGLPSLQHNDSLLNRLRARFHCTIIPSPDEYIRRAVNASVLTPHHVLREART